MIKKYKKYILTFLFFVSGIPIVNGGSLLYNIPDDEAIFANKEGYIFTIKESVCRVYNAQGLVGYFLCGGGDGTMPGVIELGSRYMLIYIPWGGGQYNYLYVIDMTNIPTTSGEANYYVEDYSANYTTTLPIFAKSSSYSGVSDFCFSLPSGGGIQYNNMGITEPVIINNGCSGYSNTTYTLNLENYKKIGEYGIMGPVYWDSTSILGGLRSSSNNELYITAIIKEIPGEILNWKYLETGVDSFLLSVYGPGYGATSYNVNLSLSGGVIQADTTEYPDKVIGGVSSTGQLLLPYYSNTEGMEEYDFINGQPLVWVNDYGDIYYIYNGDIYISALSVNGIIPPSGGGGGGGESQSDLDELLDTNFIYDKDGDGSISFSEAIQAPFVFFGGIFSLIKQGIGNFYEFIIKFQKLSPNIE